MYLSNLDISKLNLFREYIRVNHAKWHNRSPQVPRWIWDYSDPDIILTEYRLYKGVTPEIESYEVFKSDVYYTTIFYGPAPNNYIKGEVVGLLQHTMCV